MAQRSLLVLFLLISSTLGFTQDFVPDAPQPQFNRNVFVAEATALAGATTLDLVTTLKDTHEGITEAGFPAGSTYLYGSHPHFARTFPIMFGISAAQAYLGYRLEHSQNAFARRTGHVLMLGMSAAHFTSGVRNLKVEAEAGLPQPE